MKALPKCDLYFDMSYSLAYTSFANLPPGHDYSSGEALPSLYPEASTSLLNSAASSTTPKAEFTLLDLYSGCGAMSTGLCLGARISNINLMTEALLIELRHMNEEVSGTQKAGDPIKDLEHFRKQYAMVLLQLRDANDQRIAPCLEALCRLWLREIRQHMLSPVLWRRRSQLEGKLWCRLTSALPSLRGPMLASVTKALAQAGLESSNLIVGIDFTKSNE